MQLRRFLPSCRRAPFVPAAVLLGAALALTIPFLADPARAAEPVTARYEVFFGGLHVLDARARLERGTGDYRLAVEAESRGFIGWLKPWRGTSESRGRILAGKALPRHHRSWGTADEGERLVAIGYDPAGRVADTLVQPARDWDDRHPLPPDAARGTIDPLSVITGLAEQLQAGARCEGSFAVYDGRKRYDLVVSDAGEAQLEPTAYSIYAGPARGCRLDYKMLGGHRIERNKYVETARKRIVWVARPAADAPVIPVRLEIETGYGTLVGHLTGFAKGLQAEATLRDGQRVE